MALRDQPYLPLFVQDFLTDEKLMECSALATGLYIRIMCIMHKSKDYGTILLRQKDKQGSDICYQFGNQLLKHLPYSIEVIQSGLKELVSEEVLHIEGDKLLQKRMIWDNQLSIKRAEAGKKGGFATSFATPKKQANTEDEYENENAIENEDVNEKKKKTWVCSENTKIVIDYFNEKFDRGYKYSRASCKGIQARLGEGYSIEDCIKVIEIKSQDQFFQDNPKYMNPVTLFRPEKFPVYLNEMKKKIIMSPSTRRTMEAMYNFLQKHGIEEGKSGQRDIRKRDDKTGDSVSDTGV